MSSVYEIKDLELWDERIREKAEEFGLSCFPQEFEICDHHEMLTYMAYSGMPSHYPHWSYGKAYERLKTLYDHGISGLPYEMVINANPSLAYLMRDNTLLLQILTIAHVYGHNDFFKNNFTFRISAPERTTSMFRAHAKIIRSYVEDPSIGLERLEKILDAAHSLSLQRKRNLAIRTLTPDEECEALREKYFPQRSTDHPLLAKQDDPDIKGFEEAICLVPRNPTDNLLIFIADHNPHLSEWERNVLHFIDEEAQYFIPQIETRIMNEGWASYWHKQILDSLNLPQDLQMEFIVRHNQVLRPLIGGINPYHLGSKIWDNIRKRYDETPENERKEKLSSPGKSGKDMIFAVRETDRDASFIRRFLTEELMRELGLFEYEPKGEELVASAISDSEDCGQVKETLICNVGMNTVPIIKIHDADYAGGGELFLKHEYDGRELDKGHASKTIEHVYTLWGCTTILETIFDQKKTQVVRDAKGVHFNQNKKS